MNKHLVVAATLRLVLNALLVGKAVLVALAGSASQDDHVFNVARRGLGAETLARVSNVIDRIEQALQQDFSDDPSLREVPVALLRSALAALMRLDDVFKIVSDQPDRETTLWEPSGSGRDAWQTVCEVIPMVQVARIARLQRFPLPLTAAAMAWIEGAINAMTEDHGHDPHRSDAEEANCTMCALIATAESFHDVLRHTPPTNDMLTTVAEDLRAFLRTWIDATVEDHGIELRAQHAGDTTCSTCDRIEQARALVSRLSPEQELAFCGRCGDVVTETLGSIFSAETLLCTLCINDESLTPSHCAIQQQLDAGVTRVPIANMTARDASLIHALLYARHPDTHGRSPVQPTTDRVELAKRVFYANPHYARLNAYISWLHGYAMNGQWHLANSLGMADVRESLQAMSESELQRLLPA